MAAKFTTDVSNQVFLAKQLMTITIIDMKVVAATAFGLDGQSFTNPNADFRRMGDEMFKPTFFTGLKQQILLFMPFMNKFLRVS